MKNLTFVFDTSLNYFRRLPQQVAAVDSAGLGDRASRLPSGRALLASTRVLGRRAPPYKNQFICTSFTSKSAVF
ncbi:hypothetical protein QUB63_33420 [Microcoleus sp. ARI1-B5]|uniref:hypothetical protein n=1 Tax=unclassified Microcoleus TaxID=2642155 RepID=UPI002FD2400E